MTQITYDAKFIRAAQACVASQHDHRPYLRGILLAANGDVVATNGHLLFKAETGNSDTPAENVIVDINGKIPLSAERVTFNLDTNVCMTDKGKPFAFSIINGKFPTVDHIIPPRERDNHSNGFAAQTHYLAAVERVFGKRVLANVYTATEHDPLRVESPSMPDAVLVIALARSDKAGFHCINR